LQFLATTSLLERCRRYQLSFYQTMPNFLISLFK
jgi:hypothetical protein